jgi:hypothetical protein
MHLALLLSAIKKTMMSPSSHHKKVISKDTHIEYLRGDVLRLKEEIEVLKANNYALLLENKEWVDDADIADRQILGLRTIILYLETQLNLKASL